MQITLTIPDTVAGRVVDALCEEYRYGERALPGETRAQFARRMLIVYLKTLVGEVEAQLASQQADAAARDRANNEIDIT